MKKLVLIAIAMLTLAALACGGGAATPASKDATAAPGGDKQPAATQEAAPTKETAPTKEAAPSKEEPLNLSSLAEGLNTLKSYKVKLIMNFDGKDEQGQPVKGTIELQEEFTTEPKAQRIAMKLTGFEQEEQLQQMGAFEMVTIGDTSYIIFQDQEGKQSCISSSSTDNEPVQSLISPDTMGVNNAKYVKTETVNGLQAKRYTWDSSSGLPGLGFSSAKGDVWVAVDGGHVVKYTAEASGKGALFGQAQNEGTLTIEYNVVDINKKFEIKPPEDCGSAAADVPIMDDAQEKSVLGDMVTFNSPSAFADVVQFYKDEMPNQGWTLSDDATEMEGLAMLNFTKDNRKASLMISEDKDKNVVNVLITVSEE